MAHLLETMFSVKQTPWHRLGRVLEGAPATAAEAIEQAGLDWQVSRQPIFLEDGTSVPDHMAIVRDTDRSTLGVVSDGYCPLQNSEAFSFFDDVVGAKLATYETAGSLRGGRTVWILARMGEAFDVVPGDTVEPYLLLTNAHDGSRSVQSRFTPIRVVCNNTLTRAMRTAAKGPTVSVRHTKNVRNGLKQAQRVMGVARAELEQTAEAYRSLARRRVATAEIEEYLRLVVPDNAEAKSHARTDSIRKDIRELINAGLGTKVPGVRGTMWGLYNALTEYVDHNRKSTIPIDAVFDTSRDDARLASMWFGAGHALKERALEVALQSVAR